MFKKIVLFVSVSIAAAFALEPERLDSLSEYASSTVIGKDDSPVSMSGDFYVRARNASFSTQPPYFARDNAHTNVDAGLSLALGVTPTSFLNFWGNVFFPIDFTGYYANNAACQPNSEPNNYPCKMNYRHDMNLASVALQENILVGVDVRGGEFGAMFMAGGVLWVNTSPLTVWERQFTPQYVSVYETYEWERNVSTYYKEKSFKPVTEGGRAFWSNRSFGGILLDIYKLPFGFQGQAMLAQTIDDDQGTRDGLRSMNNQFGEAEGLGTLDFRSDIYMFRVAKKDVGPVALGFNFLGTYQDRDIIYENPGIYDRMGNTEGDDPNLINYMVGSMDVKGNLTQKLYLHLDIGLSIDDSVAFIREQPTDSWEQDKFRGEKSDPALAVYLKAQSKYGIPLTTEISYISQDFYSPYGMTDYSRHRQWRKDVIPLGAGAYRYTPNLAGANIKVEPEFNRGRFNVTYSQHRQVKAGEDVVSFPYRLNGRSFWESTNHWTRYNPAVFFFEDDNSYNARLGGTAAFRKDDPSGGLRGGVWELWEYFGSYESAKDAEERNVSRNTKWSSVLNVDMGYDIGHWFGTDRNIMLAATTALSSISSDFTPLPYSEDANDGTKLWGWYFQAEPTVAITGNLHALLILGVEYFRAPNAYSSANELMPIRYKETAIGGGFDWEFAPRAGLHVRYKYATHKDEKNNVNDWKANIVNAETKVWF
uniref:Uncharacterized protein n=1 Tax=uncultured bacterium contig00152 TaxID=1181591 RepID=A0A806KKY9_9BACT|nr:hypothetical protein [uncultured bacterium contig00152]